MRFAIASGNIIGGFAPVYIAEEISNNQFKIAGDLYCTECCCGCVAV